MGEEGVSPKQRLAHAKHKIKTWEGEYKATYGCPPDRDAMAEAPEDIRHAYKTYRYYRKAVAAGQKSSTHDRRSSSLTVEEDVSCSASQCDSNSLDTTPLDTTGGKEQGELGVDSGTVLTSNHKTSVEMESKGPGDNSSAQTFRSSSGTVPSSLSKPACKPSVKSTGVWGQHLNKSNQRAAMKEVPKEESLYSKMAEKLRAKSTTKTRKSLSRTSSMNKFQNKSMASSQQACTGEGNNGSGGGGETRARCNSDSSISGINSHDEQTVQHNTSNNTSTTETNGGLNISCDTKADELRPLSVFDAVEAQFNTTFSSNHNTSQELRPLNVFEAMEAESDSISSIHNTTCKPDPINTTCKPAAPINSTCKPNPINATCKPSPIDTTCKPGPIDTTCKPDSINATCKPDPINTTCKPNPISALNTMDLNIFKDIPKFHTISSRGITPTTQPINALTTLGHTHTPGLPGVKKRASLNPGWVARCTGTSLGDTTGDTQTVPPDSWKMRLIDKDWSGDIDEEPQTTSPPGEQDEDAPNTPPPRSIKPTPANNSVKKAPKNPRKKTATQTVTKRTTKKVAEALPTSQSKAERMPRTRRSRSAGRPNYADLSDDEADGGGGSSLKRGRMEDEDEPWQDMGDEREEELEDKERTHDNFAEEDKEEDMEGVENIPVSNAVVARKRKKETLEELEERGKIKSQWPPPKKVRVARKKAATGNKAKKVGKENSPKVKRTLRKRKTVQPKEEEEREEEEEVDDPATPREESVPNLDYNETEDIESHGSKTTKARGKYLTGEERMMNKISTGSLNNNFVRINIKKKIFVRGKKTMTGAKYKRQEWKKKQVMKSAEGGNAGAIKNLTCFKCGDFGHWARSCPGKRGDNLTPLDAYDEKESTFLSLDEAASMALGIKKTGSVEPATKTYPKADELESTGVENAVNASTSDVKPPPPESQEKSQQVEEEESKTINNDDQVMPSNVDLEHLKEGEDETVSRSIGESQNTNTQQTNNEEEYEFGDSDDDIFGNLEEPDITQERQEGATCTQNTNTTTTTTTTTTSSVPQSYNKFWQERPTVEPLYSLSEGKVIPTTEEVNDTLRMFGYPSFRPGQEAAIMRILSGQSTLLVLSTGSGKSLCYQLPAFLYAKHRSPCITLCVSPLVSLMEDQVTGLPGFLQAVCLHTHQTPTQRSQAIAAIHSRAAHILLVSPEAVVASRTGGVLGTLLKELPPVAFACLDEAHCVSEWSHNFRPSYLRVCQVLRERLGVKTILGLTATARTATATSIARHLLIPDFDTGVIRGTSVPDNLQLSVSRDRNREEALVTLLLGERFSSCYSIIIYCTRRDECERVATLIRSQLLDPSKVDVKSNLKRSKGLSFDAEAYHAGLSSHRRRQVQKSFMSGKLRVVVATVAFGMGIDKSDVRGIIHFNMPRNVESYVQEIGRAGRDGKDAHCHLFLDDQDGRDIQELKRHIFANSLDRHTIRKLLSKIFKPCTCAKLKNLSSDTDEKDNDASSSMPLSPSTVSNDSGMMSSDNSSSDPFSVTTASSTCPKHEVAIPIDAVVEELDLPEENLETLLCYLELHQKNLITINSHVYANCIVSCYQGPRQLVAVSRRCPPLAVAIALERQKGTDFTKSNRVTFPVVEVASRMGWNSKIVKRELKSLEWDTQDLQGGGKVKRSGVVVEMTDLSFHLEARGDLTDDEKDQVLDAVYHRTQVQEQDQLRQLHYTYQLLRSVSHNTILFCCDSVDQERCSRLRTELREYFRSNHALSEVDVEDKVGVKPEMESGIRSSIRIFLSTYEEQQWTGRAVARILHGIGSPNYPTEVWGRVRRYWRQHLNTDFNALVNIATQEILKCK